MNSTRIFLFLAYSVIAMTTVWGVCQGVKGVQVVGVTWYDCAECEMVWPEGDMSSEIPLATLELPRGKSDLVFRCGDQTYIVPVEIRGEEQYYVSINPSRDGKKLP